MLIRGNAKLEGSDLYTPLDQSVAHPRSPVPTGVDGLDGALGDGRTGVNAAALADVGTGRVHVSRTRSGGRRAAASESAAERSVSQAVANACVAGSGASADHSRS